jgi:hypothetical protein
MKHYTVLLALVCVLLLAHGMAKADQRMETWQGLCHFGYDPANANNEIYFANCENSIDVYNGAATGVTTVSQDYQLFGEFNNTRKPPAIPTSAWVTDASDPDVKRTKMIGNQTDWWDRYDTSITTYRIQNTACTMVTSNYNAGNDDNNETVYTTNNWTLIITKTAVSYEVERWDYALKCVNGQQ